MLLVQMKRLKSGIRKSMASAAFHYHIFIFLQIDIRFVQIVKNRNGTEFGGCTAWFRHFRLHQMDQCLNDGVIGCIHVCCQWEITFAGAIVRTVAIGCNNPILPLQILEADIQLLDLTTFCVIMGSWIKQRIYHIGFASAMHGTTFRAILVQNGLHKILPLEIADHKRLIFIVTFCIHQTDFVELHFVVRTIYGICTNVQAFVRATAENPFCHRIGNIQFKPTMIIRCCICRCYRLQILAITENPDINSTMKLLSLLLISSPCALSLYRYKDAAVRIEQKRIASHSFMDEIKSLTHQFRLQSIRLWWTPY